MFANETSYKIKNSEPFSQVKIYMDALGNANNELISNLYSDSEDLADATVKDILDGKVKPNFRQIAGIIQIQERLGC